MGCSASTSSRRPTSAVCAVGIWQIWAAVRPGTSRFSPAASSSVDAGVRGSDRRGEGTSASNPPARQARIHRSRLTRETRIRSPNGPRCSAQPVHGPAAPAGRSSRPDRPPPVLGHSGTGRPPGPARRHARHALVLGLVAPAHRHLHAPVTTATPRLSGPAGAAQGQLVFLTPPSPAAAVPAVVRRWRWRRTATAAPGPVGAQLRPPARPTTSTASAKPDPVAGSGGACGSSACSRPVNSTRTLSARAVNRRSQPRIVEAGR